HLDPVAGEDADVVLAHAPGDVRDDLVAVLQLHPEHGVREGFGDRAFKFNDVVFRHASCTAAWGRTRAADKPRILPRSGPWRKISVNQRPQAWPARWPGSRRNAPSTAPGWPVGGTAPRSRR